MATMIPTPLLTHIWLTYTLLFAAAHILRCASSILFPFLQFLPPHPMHPSPSLPAIAFPAKCGCLPVSTSNPSYLCNCLTRTCPRTTVHPATETDLPCELGERHGRLEATRELCFRNGKMHRHLLMVS